MKIIVVHGDHTTKSYVRLTKFLEAAKKRSWEIIEDKIETTPSLFGKERLIVFRGYLKLSPDDIKNLAKFPGTLIIYHEGVIPQLFLKKLPKDAKIENFDLPKIIWGFLDAPTPILLHEVIRHEPVEFVFALLAKRFRDLYWALEKAESLPYQGWFAVKLKKQAARYSASQLKEIISKLAEIDIDVKTSKADLLSALDFLLITKLELRSHK
jgi:hypothetical protein